VELSYISLSHSFSLSIEKGRAKCLLIVFGDFACKPTKGEKLKTLDHSTQKNASMSCSYCNARL
jgi:hypothetical protein